MQRRTLRWAALVAVLALAGCSSGDDGKDSADDSTEVPTTQAVPDECEGYEDEAEADRPVQCVDAVFNQVLSVSENEEIRELSDEERTALGRGTCAYAQAIAAQPDRLPTYAELVESNSASWGVSPAAVEEIFDNAALLCPDALGPIVALKEGQDPVRVEVAAIGEGPATVSYTVPDGGSVEEEVTLPWQRQVSLPEAEAVSVSVQATGTDAPKCEIRFELEVLTNATGEGGTVQCTVSADVIKEASR